LHRGGPIDSDVVIITEFDEFLPCKLRTVIHDDGVRDSKAVNDVKEIFHGLLGSDRHDWPSHNPFRELVNSDK
jgi:hypothetical protein